MIDDSIADMRLMTEAVVLSGLSQIATAKSCYSAYEGFAALESARAAGQVFHTILLDLNMPKQGGVELLGRIKADERFSAIPVFIVTNSDSRADIDACRALGADAYFQKPADFNRLIDFFIAVGYSLDKNKSVSVPIVERRYEELKKAA
ncbi:MAG: response regulator receiver protein [Bacteroidetes bacterium]|nr:response regulator receiver protein [Bacteroidota bacterium]